MKQENGLGWRTPWVVVAMMASLCGLAWGPAQATQAIQANPGASGMSMEMAKAVAAYERGRTQQAQSAFERLAKRGSAMAHHNLAVMHWRGETRLTHASGAARPAATRNALGWWHMQRAAEGGFVTAQWGLAQALEQGKVVPRDPERAMAWTKVAAEQGSLDAQLAMGTAHFLGRGASRDAVQALGWYRRAAIQGDVGAQYLVAAMYEQGDAGLDADARLARYWYEQAARQGDVAAAAKLRAAAESGSAGSTGSAATSPP